jgi:hypothetical protein
VRTRSFARQWKARMLDKFRSLLSRASDADRLLLLSMAVQMARGAKA